MADGLEGISIANAIDKERGLKGLSNGQSLCAVMNGAATQFVSVDKLGQQKVLSSADVGNKGDDLLDNVMAQTDKQGPVVSCIEAPAPGMGK